MILFLLFDQEVSSTTLRWSRLRKNVSLSERKASCGSTCVPYEELRSNSLTVPWRQYKSQSVEVSAVDRLGIPTNGSGQLTVPRQDRQRRNSDSNQLLGGTALFGAGRSHRFRGLTRFQRSFSPNPRYLFLLLILLKI